MFEDNFIRLTRIFEDVTKEWKLISNGIMIVPKNASFDALVISLLPLGFSSDYKWVFTTPITFGYSGDAARAYRKIKSLECSVEVKGLLRREYKFVENPVRKMFFSIIPFDEGLAKALNNDREIKTLLGKALPEELHITCYYELLPGRSQVESMIEFFRNPTKIGWLVTASKASYIEPVLPAAFRNMYRLLDALAIRLKSYTARILNEEL
jgi:hypothetical protein